VLENGTLSLNERIKSFCWEIL